MDFVFLALQVLLGLFFLFGGLRFTFQPLAALAENKSFAFVRDLPAFLVRSIGVAEALAGLALLFALTGLAPYLVPSAAQGLMLLMLCAATFHIRRREYGVLPVNGVLFALALLTAVGRWSWMTF